MNSWAPDHGSSWKGRLGGGLPGFGRFFDLGVVKEDAEVSVPYSSCYSTCKGDCSFEEAGAILGVLLLKEQKLEW